jgi:hypothetical protein
MMARGVPKHVGELTACEEYIYCMYQSWFYHLIHTSKFKQHSRSLKIAVLQLCGCTMFVYHSGMFKFQYSDIRIFLGCMWEAVLWQASHHGDLGLIQGHSICGGQWYLERVFQSSLVFPYHYHCTNTPYSYFIHLPPAYIISVIESIVK